MDRSERRPRAGIVELDSAALAVYVDQWLPSLLEEEVLSVLQNPFCSSAVTQKIARDSRLTSWYSVRLALVTHRSTPQSEAMRFVGYLYWADLARVSTSVRIAPAVRRAADLRLIAQVDRMSPGERITLAKQCSRELIRVLLFDPDRRVVDALLINPRLTEDDVMRLAGSDRAGGDKLALVADHPRWSQRYVVRLALVTNPATPKAVAASQLRHLRPEDLSALLRHPATSIYLRRCIEGLAEP